MTVRFQRTVLAERHEIIPPPTPRTVADHSFELPAGLFWASIASLFGFVAVLAVGFSDREMVVPMGVIVFFLAMFFAIPAIFVRMAPEASRHSMGWSELMESGVDTATGQTTGREAAVLVLMLPLLVLFWAIAVTAIAGIV